MPEAGTWPIFATLAIMAGMMICFMSGRFRSDAVAFCSLLALMVTGVLTPQEAISGFSNPIIPTIVGVFMIGGAIVRSGLSVAIGNGIMRLGGKNSNVLFMLLMLITAGIGSLVSNVGTVAIMMPIVAGMAISLNVSPSRFLMPLAFMSGIGGMLTLIGNAANMVVNEVYVKAGFESLRLFSFLPVGLVSLAFGMLVLVPATYFYLGRRKSERNVQPKKDLSLEALADKYHLDKHMHRIAIPSGSVMVGQNLASLNLTGRFGVYVQEIRRAVGPHGHFGPVREKWFAPGPLTVLEKGDTLYCQGSLEKLQSMSEEYGLKILSSESAHQGHERYHFDILGICELVLMSSSRLVQRTVQDSGLRERFGLSVLGIQRGDQYIMEDIPRQTLHSGDALLVQGLWKDIGRLAEFTDDWVVVGRPKELAKSNLRRDKLPFVAGVIILMFAAMATGFLPNVLAVLLAVAALGFGKCFRNVEEAYSFINWETVIMVACMLPLAIAMEKTGLITKAALHITELGQHFGPMAAMALIYITCSMLNIVISSTPVALIAAPVAIQVALDLGCDPLPFVFGVATAACMSFASPFSMPANALVMSAGRYTFMDYLKIGLPLQILMAALMIPVIPLLFPF